MKVCHTVLKLQLHYSTIIKYSATGRYVHIIFTLYMT